MKCEKCNRGTDHNYNGMELCKYHYWIELGKSKTNWWKHMWKEYKYFHPVKVARWREQDKKLNTIFEDIM